MARRSSYTNAARARARLERADGCHAEKLAAWVRWFFGALPGGAAPPPRGAVIARGGNGEVWACDDPQGRRLVLKTGITAPGSEQATTSTMATVLAEALLAWVALEPDSRRRWARELLLEPAGVSLGVSAAPGVVDRFSAVREPDRRRGVLADYAAALAAANPEAAEAAWFAAALQRLRALQLDCAVPHMIAEVVYPHLDAASGWFTLHDYLALPAHDFTAAQAASALLTTAAAAVLLWRESRLTHGDMNGKNVMLRHDGDERFAVKLVDLGWSACLVGRTMLDANRLSDVVCTAWENSANFGAHAAEVRLAPPELPPLAREPDDRAVQTDVAKLLLHVGFAVTTRREALAATGRRLGAAADKLGLLRCEKLALRHGCWDGSEAAVTRAWGRSDKRSQTRVARDALLRHGRRTRAAATLGGFLSPSVAERFKRDLVPLVSARATEDLHQTPKSAYELLFERDAKNIRWLTDGLTEPEWAGLWQRNPGATLPGLFAMAADCGMPVGRWRDSVCDPDMAAGLVEHGRGADERFEGAGAAQEGAEGAAAEERGASEAVCDADGNANP
jgi:hypothetical protein